MFDILVITCPSGRQCSHLIPMLYGKGKFKLRLAAHSRSSLDRLQAQYPDAEVRQVDITNLSERTKLLEGATSVYHVGPSLHSHEKEIGLNMVDAAVTESRRSGNVFKHFVFSSVLCTQHRNLMQHDLKSYIEERLFLSPINWTILKPTNFMDAFPVALLASQDEPVMERLWSPYIGNSLVALHDLAEASAKVLNERDVHYLAEYPLCSTMPISDADVCNVLSRQIGRRVEVKAPSFEVGVNKLMKLLFGDATGTESDLYGSADQGAALTQCAEGDLRGDIARDGAERLILFYNRRGLVGSPNVLRWLLGREPTTVEQWVEGQLQKKDRQ